MPSSSCSGSIRPTFGCSLVVASLILGRRAAARFGSAPMARSSFSVPLVSSGSSRPLGRFLWPVSSARPTGPSTRCAAALGDSPRPRRSHLWCFPPLLMQTAGRPAASSAHLEVVLFRDRAGDRAGVSAFAAVPLAAFFCCVARDPARKIPAPA